VDERWLLTYADLITLLMALFMVLFSISSVNTSKFESLQRSLQEAFSGKILPGGQGIQSSGGSNNIKNPSADQAQSSLQPLPAASTKAKGKADSEAEERALKALQRRVEEVARAKGLSGKVQVRLAQDGLHIRVLTDDLLFDSGQATPKPQSVDLLSKIGHLLAGERSHQIIVEGHTDTVPVAGSYPTNWELSTARASSVVRAFATSGVGQGRMIAAGRAYLDPAASNKTAGGRTVNRRVEILLPRQTAPPAEASPFPTS
jgi:chemotaxis protein MotB